MLTGIHKKIEYGSLSIDGFLLSNGKFGVYQTQLILLAGVTTDTRQAAKRYIEIANSKTTKTIAPQGFIVHRNVEIQYRSEQVNIVELSSVAQYLTVCLAMGYTDSAPLVVAFCDEALHQIFCDNFNIERTEQDRRKNLSARFSGVDTRKLIEGKVHEYYEVRGMSLSDRGQKLARLTNNIYKAVFGKTASDLRIERGIKTGQYLRNFFNESELRTVQGYEEVAYNQLCKGLSPDDAISFAITSFDDGRAQRELEESVELYGF